MKTGVTAVSVSGKTITIEPAAKNMTVGTFKSLFNVSATAEWVIERSGVTLSDNDILDNASVVVTVTGKNGVTAIYRNMTGSEKTITIDLSGGAADVKVFEGSISAGNQLNAKTYTAGTSAVYEVPAGVVLYFQNERTYGGTFQSGTTTKTAIATSFEERSEEHTSELQSQR